MGFLSGHACREVIEIQKEAIQGRYKVMNAMQTNGTLINEQWADLFAELKFGPSVSIDGPAEHHDQIRTYLDGKPTYEHAMRGYRLLRERGINSGMLVVASKVNLNNPEKLWEWVLQEKIEHFDVLPCIEPELWREGKQQYGLSSDEVSDFYIKLFDLWFDHQNPDIVIRTFRDAVKGILGGKVNICSWKAGCLQHISFDASGSAFPCARYHSYPETNMGSITEMNFSDIMQTPTTKKVYQGIADGLG